jgi:mono/diheme cytochrome c family protein
LRRAALLSLAALALVGCGTGGLAADDGNIDIGEGKLLFNQRCGGCHTLEEAGTRGSTGNPSGGPNLDEAFAASREEGFDESTIREVVLDQIAFPTPPMPADLVEGADADAVAAYVARVAGVTKPPKVALPAGSGGDDPKLVFQSNCATCHALADAGATGEIGPDLDKTKPTVEKAVRQIANGGGGMPPFRGQLTNAQIRALAEYIVRVGGKG